MTRTVPNTSSSIRPSSLPARLMAAAFALLSPLALAQDLMTPRHVEQRQLYRDALDALARNDRARFEERRSQLADYALRPYLDYTDLSSRIAGLPEAEVHDFLALHGGSVVGQRLQRQWLEALVAAGDWERLIVEFDPRAATTELRCQALFARVRAGDTTAFDEVPALWNVPRSQTNVCDPLFNAWRDAGHLTPAVAWERFSGAINAGQTGLANYLSGIMPERERAFARLWLDTLAQPTRLSERSNYAAGDPEVTQILLHTLRRLSQSNSELAWELAQQYADEKGWASDTRIELQRYIAMRLLTQGHTTQAEVVLRADPALPSDTLIEWLLRDSLKLQQWERFDSWLPLLSAEAQASERWRYWQARSLMQRGTMEAQTAARALFAEVAETRSFYGFLSSDLLGRDYSLVDRPVQATDEELQALLANPALLRAFELYFVEDETNALREWQSALSNMSEQEVLAAGKLADRLGWHRNGIQALIQVSYWDDLAIRFPLAYQDLVGAQASRYEQLDPTFIYAIARQESAFITNARSSAGALGLMQLMPATARETAKSVGMNISSNQQILEPSVNLALGSRYLSQMLQSFGGNRILAAAAYNAGPGRVRQWLAQTGGQRPLDIWIETIPFAETRGYVQNVLAFSVIYGHRMGQPVAMLKPEEAQAQL